MSHHLTTQLSMNGLPKSVAKKHDILLKRVFEENFAHLLRFFYKDADLLFDLHQKFQPMSTELVEIIPDRRSLGGTRIADLLFKVAVLGDINKDILIHLEIQTAIEGDFGFRMYQYQYRLSDRFKVPVIAMAIFTGRKEQNGPDVYKTSLFGTEVIYKYKTY